eukprot:7382817-Prymnesium_polylepis.1
MMPARRGTIGAFIAKACGERRPSNPFSSTSSDGTPNESDADGAGACPPGRKPSRMSCPDLAGILRDPMNPD